MSSVIVEHLPTFWLQNDSKLHINCKKTRCWTFSIFRLIWSHSAVFLKQKAAIYPSNNVLYCFCFFVLTVLELTTKALRNLFRHCIKTTKTFSLLTFSESICGVFHYKLYLSLNKSSRKRGVLPLFRAFNILVHEIYRQFDKSCMKVWKFCLFQCQFDIFFILKTAIIS